MSAASSDADHAALFVRVDRVVARPSSARRSAVSVSSASSGILASDGPIFTCDENGGAQAAEHTQAGHRHVLAERIRDEIDGVTESRSARGCGGTR